MMLISQDGHKAIDTADILYYVIFPLKGEADEYELMVEPNRYGSTGEDYFGKLILFRDKNLDTVKHVMRFLASGRFFIPSDSYDGSAIEVNINNLRRHGMRGVN